MANQKNGMLKDGSNPEGVDPSPPLDWNSVQDLKNVCVSGNYLSPPTTKLRCYLIYRGVQHQFKVYLPGKVPNTDYKKIPILFASGRQINDSEVILKNLLPLLDIPTDKDELEMERRINEELAVSLKLHNTHKDWGMQVGPLLTLPGFMAPLVGRVIRSDKIKEGKNNLKLGGGYKEVDELQFCQEFKAGMKGQKFFHGDDEPGPADITLYGQLAGFVFVDAPIAKKLISGAGLTKWLASMKQVIPLDKLYQGAPNGVVTN